MDGVPSRGRRVKLLVALTPAPLGAVCVVKSEFTYSGRQSREDVFQLVYDGTTIKAFRKEFEFVPSETAKR